MKKEKFMKNGHPYEIREISDENGIKVQIFDEITGKPVGPIVPNMKSEDASDAHFYGQYPIKESITALKNDFLNDTGVFLDLSKLV